MVKDPTWQSFDKALSAASKIASSLRPYVGLAKSEIKSIDLTNYSSQAYWSTCTYPALTKASDDKDQK